VTGETITFVRTARDTGGAAVELRFAVTPGGAVPATHVHPEQTETFTVHRGRCRVRVGDAERMAGPGDVVVVPAGAPHAWEAVDDLDMTVVLEPALRVDDFFVDLFALAVTPGGVDAEGMPRPLHLAALAHEYRGLLYVAGPPIAVQRVAFAALARLGRALGRTGPWLHHALTVAAPPEDVFAALTAFERIPEWIPGITRAHPATDEPVGEGTAFVEELRIAGRATSVTGTVTEHDPGRVLAYVYDSGPIPGRWRYALTPEGDGTRLDFTLAARRGLPLVSRLVARAVRRNLAAFAAWAPGAYGAPQPHDGSATTETRSGSIVRMSTDSARPHVAGSCTPVRNARTSSARIDPTRPQAGPSVAAGRGSALRIDSSSS
jgi:quercetin dioxygenase-like cupin family protein/uncharacterized protein YndB with AHSA1/START domain